MQQIADWLEKLGMSEYAERFAENRIDLSVLPDLTDQDLEKLGVVLGDRRKMLRAIVELGGAAPVSPQPTLTESMSGREAGQGPTKLNRAPHRLLRHLRHCELRALDRFPVI
jgi:SAM domain (Sterile alpha motif)